LQGKAREKLGKNRKARAGKPARKAAEIKEKEAGGQRKR